MAVVKHLSVECDAEGCSNVLVFSGGSVDKAGVRRLARDDHGWHTAGKDYCPTCKLNLTDGRGRKQTA